MLSLKCVTTWSIERTERWRWLQENLMWEVVSLLITTMFPRHSPASPATLNAKTKSPSSSNLKRKKQPDHVEPFQNTLRDSLAARP